MCQARLTGLAIHDSLNTDSDEIRCADVSVLRMLSNNFIDANDEINPDLSEDLNWIIFFLNGLRDFDLLLRLISNSIRHLETSFSFQQSFILDITMP